MARKLTTKQRKFVDKIADGKTGMVAALESYDIESHKDRNASARAIASQNLSKPQVIAALRELGFDESNADRVVAEILNNGEVEPSTRLVAADKIYKRMGSYAAEKSVSLSANMSVEQLKDAIATDMARFRNPSV